MTILSGLLGNAGPISEQDVRKELGKLFAEDEQVLRGYKLVRDLIVLTDRRVILVDKQGLTGRKVEYRSLPYKSITHFSVETAGHFDLDADLKLWLSGLSEPIIRKFSGSADVYELQALLAQRVAR
jgi:hypothetical protein